MLGDCAAGSSSGGGWGETTCLAAAGKSALKRKTAREKRIRPSIMRCLASDHFLHMLQLCGVGLHRRVARARRCHGRRGTASYKLERVTA